jgi:hypothetical protein
MKQNDTHNRIRKIVSFEKFDQQSRPGFRSEKLWGLALATLWGLISFGMAGQRILHPAFGVQGDLPLHYHITRAYSASLGEGDWLPRWAGLLDGGRGDALFTFYPPLSYLLTGAIEHLPGVDFLTSIKIVLILIFFLAQASAYCLARCFSTRRRAAVASLFYALLPAYPLIALSRGFFANALGLALAPLVLAGCHRILTDDRAMGGVALFAAASSAVVLTHTITTYLCGIAAGLMVLSYLPWIERARLLRLLWAGLFTLALTAFFLAPQQMEMSWVKIGMQVSEQNYRDYLLFAKPRDDSQYRRVWAGLNQVAGYITLAETALALLLALACAPLLRSRSSPTNAAPILWFVIALAVLGLLISLPISAPLWEWAPGLRYIQFPWRFQAFVALGCGLTAIHLPDAWKGFKPLTRVLVAASIGLTALICLGLSFLLIRLNQPGVSQAEVASRLNGLEQWAVPPIPMEQGRKLQSENERAYTAYTANQIYFRPTEADLNLYAPAIEPGGLSFVTGDGTANPIKLMPSHREFQIEAREPSVVRLESYHYPHWVVTLDGREIPVRTEPSDGRMLIDVPAGTSRLEATFVVRDPIQRAARALSALAWAVFLGILAYRRLNLGKHAS